MAFKKTTKDTNHYDSIESLFRDIRTKKVEALYSHQANVLKRYETEFKDAKDIALDLPTGSGKTLIGLLIGEYLRRMKGEKILFLCSTKQLVNQVVDLANNKYGIKATAFIGSKGLYTAENKADYQTGSTIAVTTYSSLFNVNPFFKDPGILILDDAHVAENYISSNWSLSINREGNEAIYKQLLLLLKNGLDNLEYSRLKEDAIDPLELNTVQLVPTHTIYGNQQKIIDYLNSVLNPNDNSSLYFPWTNIKDHLNSCQIYISWKTILIRPIIPPTLKIKEFENAKQRIYMSATLGESGDLERILGIRKIARIPLPEGWDKQGSGRRFFVFPEMCLDKEGKKELFIQANKLFDRSLTLVPDSSSSDYFQELGRDNLKFEIFTAHDIEKSKSDFVSKKNALAIVANRYEGIDFAGDDCRLLFIANISKVNNLQETFLSQRMGSQIVLLDRIRTRITQAIGRCTRGASDFSCVIIMGEDLGEFFLSNKFNKYFHPEIQGEVTFGITQSTNSSVSEILENIKIFTDQGDDWRDAESDIFKVRDESKQEKIPGSNQVNESAIDEIDYQYAMWNKDYQSAVKYAQNVINKLSGGKILNGYRGYWHYLASVASFLASKELGLKEFDEKSKAYLADSSKCSLSISWLRKLSLSNENEFENINTWDDDLVYNIERLESIIIENGISNSSKFEKEMSLLEQGLASNDAKIFEKAHETLGKYLGYVSKNENSTAAPDPYWITNNKTCFVFEDYTDSKGNLIPVHKARQAKGHIDWINHNIKIENLEIFSILVSDSDKLDPSAIPFVDGVYFYKLSDFRNWAYNAIHTLRDIRASFVSGSAIWREYAMEKFLKEKLTPKQLIDHVINFPLKSF